MISEGFSQFPGGGGGVVKDGITMNERGRETC